MEKTFEEHKCLAGSKRKVEEWELTIQLLCVLFPSMYSDRENLSALVGVYYPEFRFDFGIALKSYANIQAMFYFFQRVMVYR